VSTHGARQAALLLLFMHGQGNVSLPSCRTRGGSQLGTLRVAAV
jgi:hypothetical protein